MKFKEIKRNGVFCWSPTRHEASLAIGSTSQQFDTNFSTDSTLGVYGLNIDKSSEELCLRSSKVVTNPFQCIAWHPKTLIAGTQLKTLQLYNVLNEDIVLKHETEAQKSCFTCLDLNPKESHLLAAGCDDGSIGVWDIETNGKPERNLNLNSMTANDSVNVVKWNRQVCTILAAASNSNVHVWDTRKAINSGPIMRVHDNNATSLWGSGPQSLMISRSLVWSESNPTALILANSNDANPILQLWDLRYATCPLNHFKGGHSRGIQSISWNKYDEQLLLSAGKDNAVCLWNPSAPLNEESLQAVIPYITNQWISDIVWCDWEPSLFAINSFDGNTSVYNLTQTNSLNQTNTKILESFDLNSQQMSQQMQPSVQRQPILTRAPNWLRTPCRASFGFGAKLVTYDMVLTQTQTQTQPSTQYTQHIITVHQVMSDSELINRSEKLENALSNGNFMDYCLYKMSEHSDNENLLMAWKLIALHLEADSQQQREGLLELLGFDGKKSNNCIENLCDLTNSQLSTKVMTNNLSQKTSELSQSFGTEFYENIGNNSIDKTLSPKLPNSLSIDTSDSGLGTLINRGILSGDLEPVVKTCIENNNWTEAILLCCFVAPEHTTSTLRKYFDYCLQSKADSWSPLLWCIISAQTARDEEGVQIFEELIEKVDLKYWKQVLTFIIRESENWEELNTKTLLIDNLAKRLINNYVDSASKQWLNAGMFCYLINGDHMNVSQFVPFGSHLDRIELSLILQKSTNSEFVVNQLTAHYSKLLAVEGKLELALKYIDDNEMELKDRIINNLRPNRRTTSQTQAVGPRVYQNMPSNRAPAYPTPVPTPVQYMPPMPSPYGAAQNISHSYPQSLPPVPHMQPMAPPVAPVVPNIPSLPQQIYSQQNPTYPTVESYRTHNYNEQQFSPPPVTPGWNDPPVLTNSRHNSFSAPHTEPNPQIFTPMAANTISTPLPVFESESVPQNVQQMSQTRRQSVQTIAPSEPLSPQNQQIYDSFDRLLSDLQQSPNSQALNIRRKLEDSRLKLETLKSKLGSNSQLSSNAVSGLSQIANAINSNDLVTALDCHQKLVASTTFGETAAFLPALKVIIHLAQQRIYS